MKASNPYLRHGVTALASLALVLGVAGARADTTAKQVDAFPRFENYIKIGVQGASLSGNEAAFQARTQQPKSGAGGIEAFHYGKELEHDRTLTLDGRALAASEDYLGKLNLTKTDVGSFEMGYKTFRTFYDGVGGFFPLGNTWMAMSPEALHVDRGQFWAEARLNLPNLPAFTLKYSNETRSGKKDSLILGDTDFTGLPNNNPPYSQVRKVAPSYLKLDERHAVLEATTSHTIGRTSFQVTLLNDQVKNVDTRYGTRFPGEVRPFPTPPSTLLVPAANMNNQIAFSQTDGNDGQTFLARATAETVFTEKIKLLAGVSYEDLSNDFSGDRPLFTTVPTAVGTVVAVSNNFQNLAGNSKATVYAGNLAVELTPTKNFTAKLAVLGRDKYTKSAGTLTSVSASASTSTGVVTTTATNQQNFSRFKEKSWTPELNLGYKGISNMALYATARKKTATGDDYYATPFSTVAPASNNLVFSNPSEDHAYYNVGANWRQSASFTLRADVFYKDHVNKVEGYGIGLGNYYNLATQFNGVKLSAIAKPGATVTFTTRFVYQKGKAQVTAPSAATAENDSMDAKNYSIGETINWTPSSQVYFQANANIVFNTIKSVDGRAGIVAAGTNPAWDANNVLKNSDNNYVTASLLAGFVLTKVDDLQIQFSYYRAANGNPEVAFVTVPYGADAKEFSVMAGLKHKFSDRLMGEAKVGYYDSKNDYTGGNTNFRGPQAFFSLTYAL